MPYKTKRQKEQRLNYLKHEIVKVKKEMNDVSQEMTREFKRMHISELLKAGKIVEDAGILGSYHEADLYLLLVMNRDYLKTGKIRLMKKMEDNNG